MRKLICMMLTFLLCLSLLSGCGMDYECTTYLTSTSNSMDVKLPVSPIWTQEIPEALEEYTIEFQGNTYTGAYSDSNDPIMCSFASHRYVGDNFYFRVRANTGELISFSFFTPDFSEKEIHKQDVPDPEKTAMEIAERTASAYIDTSKYARSVSSDVNSVDVEGETFEYTTYSVIYSKEVCGIPTDDTVRVYVTSKGTLDTVVLGEIGAFDHIQRNAFSLEKVEASIAEKLLEMEQQTESCLFDDYEITEHSLHLTPEKELAVVSLVNVQWKMPDGNISRHVLQMTTLLQ